MTDRPRGIFVVGTDTGVGKTRVAAAVARTWVQAGHRVGVIKPVSTGGQVIAGALRSADVDSLIRAVVTANSPFPPPPIDRVGPLIYEAPLAPPVAARVAGQRLASAEVIHATESSIEWWIEAAKVHLLVIEGVGGLLCPIAEDGWTVADLATHLDYPLLIVARTGLGTLNHTLLTVEAARARGLRVTGILLNAALEPEGSLAEVTNAEELASCLPSIPILGVWAYDLHSDGTPVAPESGNWLDLALIPRTGSIPGTSVRMGQRFSPVDGVTLSIPGFFHDADHRLRSEAAHPATLEVHFSDASCSTPASVRALPSIDLLPNDQHFVNPSRRSAMKEVFFLSYASAVTLALSWTLYSQRVVRPPVVEFYQTPSDDERLGAGRLSNRSRRVAPPAIIPDDRMIDIGGNVQVNSLLIEPLSMNLGEAILERIKLTGDVERRAAGSASSLLKVRLQNRSADQVFAPIDPTFVRSNDGGVVETYYETDFGQRIYPYELAVASEWSIVGQSFADLRPGEAREVVFVSMPAAPLEVGQRPGTWRIKLRTGVDSTAVVGVRLGPMSAP